MLIELLEGRITSAVVDLVTRTAEAVARTRKFATPSGSRLWTQHDVDDLVGEFFSKPGRIFDLAAAAGTGEDAEARFKGMTEKAIKRVAIDRFRKGPRGVLHERVNRRVAARADISVVPPQHWAIDPWHSSPHWGGDDAELVAAAGSVTVVEQKWSEDSNRQAPSGTGATVDAICTAVLSTAQAPVRQPVVRAIVCDRIIGPDLGHVVDADALPERSTGSPAVEPGWVDLEAAALEASLIADILTPDDLALLPYLDEPAREVEKRNVLGLGKSAIAERQRKLKDTLAPFLASVPDQELVASCLLRTALEAQTGQDQGVAT
jgi:hypothetical protein